MNNLLLAFLIKFIGVMLLIGWIPALIAKSKGRSFVAWWIYGGALFIVALIHAIVMKPLSSTSVENKSAPINKTKCDHCGETFPSGYYLERVENRGYLCSKCRTVPS